MGEPSPYIELENRLRFLEQERELETARLLRLGACPRKSEYSNRWLPLVK